MYNSLAWNKNNWAFFLGIDIYYRVYSKLVHGTMLCFRMTSKNNHCLLWIKKNFPFQTFTRIERIYFWVLKSWHFWYFPLGISDVHQQRGNSNDSPAILHTTRNICMKMFACSFLLIWIKNIQIHDGEYKTYPWLFLISMWKFVCIKNFCFYFLLLLT